MEMLGVSSLQVLERNPKDGLTKPCQRDYWRCYEVGASVGGLESLSLEWMGALLWASAEG